ncbi:type VI secretion system ATPase TssH, partial [Bacteroidetes/Chlorobi group bacterium ChocPot_Mid]
MNYRKFTLKSQEAIQTAQEIAESYNNQAIEPIHLFAALVQDIDSLVVQILKKLGVNVNTIKIKINEELSKLPKISGATQHYFSSDMNKVFDEA